MDRELENFLLGTVASTFTSIGSTLSLILERRMGKSTREETKAVPTISAEVKTDKPATNEAESPKPIAEAPVITNETEKVKKEETKPEAPKHKTTIVEVRKIMTELSRKGKGKVIQDVLSKDFNVTKLSDIKEEDYDDFVTRVLYYADEKDAFVEVDNA